ncbi:hypothetical protein ACFLIM_48430 [Nonomuraea sp. M3C6]|uniref:Uncharacterized protein n=1 Tax=Nonomuraea marmarensis TaxID=3351344 RepID=A0ABW7AVG8_9ACTN
MLIALAWIAGASLPPVSMAMRIAWARRMPEGHPTAAYSLVFLVQEVAIFTGPSCLA